jgi:hypothetical protein
VFTLNGSREGLACEAEESLFDSNTSPTCRGRDPQNFSDPRTGKTITSSFRAEQADFFLPFVS